MSPTGLADSSQTPNHMRNLQFGADNHNGAIKVPFTNSEKNPLKFGATGKR